jgi:3-oxoacyl-[acyl-carrier protein] reductase
MIDLTGKTALVTGASRGIGAATARRLAKAGASIILAARSLDEATVVAAEIVASGGAAQAVACDVALHADVAATITLCVERLGGLDILVNNAGLIEPIARIADSDTAAWSSIIDINVKGVYFGLREAIPAMVARGGGTIVTISSGAATSPLEGWSHYCASKAAALMLTRCADMEYRAHGIRAVGLSPGTVATGMQVAIKASGINPVSQLDSSAHIPPEWAAEAVAWLCTDAATPYLGGDFSLKSPEGRALVGLEQGV